MVLGVMLFVAIEIMYVWALFEECSKEDRERRNWNRRKNIVMFIGFSYMLALINRII